MILFEIFAAIVSVFIKALLALILFPLWILVIIVTSPLRIFSVPAHHWVIDKFFDAALFTVFMGRKGF